MRAKGRKKRRVVRESKERERKRNRLSKLGERHQIEWLGEKRIFATLAD